MSSKQDELQKKVAEVKQDADVQRALKDTSPTEKRDKPVARTREVPPHPRTPRTPQRRTRPRAVSERQLTLNQRFEKRLEVTAQTSFG